MENFENIAITSRIRLARNVSGINFFTKLTNEEDAMFIIDSVLEILEQTGSFNYYYLKDLSINECNALLEKHFISKELIDNKDISCMAINNEQNIAIMLNEEDHIREQCMHEGFNLLKPYRELQKIDKQILNQIDIAYNDDYGFITSCPTNLGTAMRASVMLFLPGLERNGEIDIVFNEVKEKGLTVRGFYGEGSGTYGSFYQISNQLSLGLNEQEIIDNVSDYVFTICEMEASAREDILTFSSNELKDEIYRAVGILESCFMITEKEMIELLSKIKFGYALGFLEISNLKKFDSLYYEGASANLKINYVYNNPKDESIIRAEFIRDKIRILVQREGI
ncbi:MAG: ATP--guanido phosphotransferase [Clostridia bacterium]|nr:ATP--guanido phosphotransferase [Clostridia bacterium]